MSLRLKGARAAPQSAAGDVPGLMTTKVDEATWSDFAWQVYDEARRQGWSKELAAVIAHHVRDPEPTYDDPRCRAAAEKAEKAEKTRATDTSATEQEARAVRAGELLRLTASRASTRTPSAKKKPGRDSATVVVFKADLIRSACKRREYDDATAARLFALGHSERSAIGAMRAAGSNKQGFALQTWARLRYVEKDVR